MEEKSSLYIVAIVGIVAVVALIIFIAGREKNSAIECSTTEDAVGQVMQVAPNDNNTEPTCTDTDGGEFFEERGIVTYTIGNPSTVSYKRSMAFDYCIDDNINEAVCYTGADGIITVGWTGTTCPNGCVDSACIR